MPRRRRFGCLLRDVRLKRGMSQAQVGQPHYTRAFISALELGKANPSAEALVHIASTLAVDVEELLDTTLAETARTSLFLDLAERYLEQSDPEVAFRILAGLREPRQKAPRYRFRYSILRARVELERRLFDAAADWLTAALEATSPQTYEEQAVVEFYRGVVYHMKDQAVDALGHYRTAYVFLDRLDRPDPQLVSHLNRNLGTALWRLDNFEEARLAYERSLEAAREVGDQRAETGALVGLANCLRHEHEYEAAIAVNEQALAVIEQHGLNDLRAKVYNNLGVIYARKGDFDTAIKRLKTSLELRGHLPNATYTLNELAGVYLARNQLDDAEGYACLAARLGGALEDRVERSYSYWILGRLCWRRGNIEEALEYYSEAANLLGQVCSPHRLAALQLELSILFASMSRMSASVDAARRGLRALSDVMIDSPLHGTVD